jgi:hypothetical protein
MVCCNVRTEEKISVIRRWAFAQKGSEDMEMVSGRIFKPAHVWRAVLSQSVQWTANIPTVSRMVVIKP